MKPAATPMPETRARLRSGATVASSGWYCESAVLNANVAMAPTTSASRIESTTPSRPVAATHSSVNTMRIGLWRPQRSASAPISGSVTMSASETEATIRPT